MEVKKLIAILLIVFYVTPAPLPAAKISGLPTNHFDSSLTFQDKSEFSETAATWLYLRKGTGELTINGTSSEETYEAYFLIPIPFQEQMPVFIEVESPDLIEYRFLRLNPPNILAVARMNCAPMSTLTWTAWVLIQQNSYFNLPHDVPIPTSEQLPDSVKQWLEATDCAQVSAPVVQNIAQAVKDTATTLFALAQNVCDYCYDIPWEWPHTPFALDAVYALTWGSSCTGHAHAAVALFRANGVPARTLLSMPIGMSEIDMHWILQYFVPEYGWVRMEPSMGQHPNSPPSQIITLACNSEDEFPLFFPSGIEGYWHTSDPALGMYSPDWRSAHSAMNMGAMPVTSEETVAPIRALSDSVFSYYTDYFGITLNATQQVHFQNALNAQENALANLQSFDTNGYISNMTLALDEYTKVDPEPIVTIFIDDFENGAHSWEHGGVGDEWEVGAPGCGPALAHSGLSCWGTDLDGNYENDADNWLMSPPIDLSDYSCVYLNFWVWNWVEDENQGLVHDPLWLDITADNGVTFHPLCSFMGGVNDDPEIPDIGGWTKMALDLTNYIGETVHIRFRFRSNSAEVQAGSYLDDVKIYGRLLSEPSDVAQSSSAVPISFTVSQNYPNPFNATAKIDYSLSQKASVEISIYTIQGKKISTLVAQTRNAGTYAVIWDGCDADTFPVASGIYLCKIQIGDGRAVRKLMLVR